MVRTLCSPASGRHRALREHHGALSGGRVPRALAHLHLRRSPGRARVLGLHRLGRPDGAQPGPSRRGAGSHRGSRRCRANSWRPSRSRGATISSRGCSAPIAGGVVCSRSITSRPRPSSNVWRWIGPGRFLRFELGRDVATAGSRSRPRRGESGSRSSPVDRRAPRGSPGCGARRNPPATVMSTPSTTPRPAGVSGMAAKTLARP